MQKYCDNTDTDSAGSTVSADHVVESVPLQIPVDLRLDYSVDFNMTPDLDKDQKLVKQEYISYVAQVSSVGMDILKFWEVCRTCVTDWTALTLYCRLSLGLHSFLSYLTPHHRALRLVSYDTRTCDELSSMAFHDVPFLGPVY
jgi:hypothetical protein